MPAGRRQKPPGEAKPKGSRDLRLGRDDGDTRRREPCWGWVEGEAGGRGVAGKGQGAADVLKKFQHE